MRQLKDAEQAAFTLSRAKFDAVLFNLDGVVTKTAQIHAAAWKAMFDEYMQRLARFKEFYRPFDPNADSLRYVNGKPRYAGVQSFLKSRGLELTYGSPNDVPGADTVCGLGNRKNQIFLELLQQAGVEVFESSRDFIRALKANGFLTAVVSASRNCGAILKAAGATDLFDFKVNGTLAARAGLAGKPAPDMFLEAAGRLKVEPARTAVVEDAVAGVKAGRAGRFGWVVGVDRKGHPGTLKEAGADIVIADVSELGIANRPAALPPPPNLKHIAAQTKSRHLAVFLDYDGTLTPSTDRPDQAMPDEEMRRAIKRLAQHGTVALISGRDLTDIHRLVDIADICYAGCHGLDISGPHGRQVQHRRGIEAIPLLDRAEKALQQQLGRLQGIQVERKQFCVAVHYRMARQEDLAAVDAIVERTLIHHPGLRRGYGKKVYELLPRIEWNKRKAVQWLLAALGLDRPDVLPLYIGDDTTDEDAFRALQDRGITIAVMKHARQTAAQYALRDPDQVRHFLDALGSLERGG